MHNLLLHETELYGAKMVVVTYLAFSAMAALMKFERNKLVRNLNPNNTQIQSRLPNMENIFKKSMKNFDKFIIYILSLSLSGKKIQIFLLFSQTFKKQKKKRWLLLAK